MKRKSWFTMNILVVLVLVVCVGCSNKNAENDTEILYTEEKTTEEEVITEEEMTDQEITEENEIVESEDTSILEDEYLLEDSDQVVISSLELANMTLDELRIARNEIYARHGFVFESSDLKEYFEGKDWYNPSVTDIEEVELTYTEQVNVKLISEQECFQGEGVSILASIYSTDVISLSNNWLTIKVQEDTLTSYITFTDSWDYVTTTEIAFELADNCEWYICSPLALHGDYSDAIESDEEEIMQILLSELEAKIAADENGDPFDTSMSIMIKVEDGKIVQICQVSA